MARSLSGARMRSHRSKRFEFLCWIGAQIDLRALQGCMAKPQGDFPNVAGRPQGMHRAGMAQNVWTDPFFSDRRCVASSRGDVLLEDVLEARAGHGFTPGVYEQLGLATGWADFQPCLYRRCRLLPERQDTFTAAFAQTKPGPAGHWEGTVQLPDRELQIVVDLAKDDKGAWIGAFAQTTQNVRSVPLADITVTESNVKFRIAAGGPNAPAFDCNLENSTSMNCKLTTPGGTVTVPMKRTGEAKADGGGAVALDRRSAFCDERLDPIVQLLRRAYVDRAHELD